MFLRYFLNDFAMEPLPLLLVVQHLFLFSFFFYIYHDAYFLTLPFVSLFHAIHVTEYRTLQGETINGMVILSKLELQVSLFKTFIEFAAGIH
jgi:hypothetical protein